MMPTAAFWVRRRLPEPRSLNSIDLNDNKSFQFSKISTKLGVKSDFSHLDLAIPESNLTMNIFFTVGVVVEFFYVYQEIQ